MNIVNYIEEDSKPTHRSNASQVTCSDVSKSLCVVDKTVKLHNYVIKSDNNEESLSRVLRVERYAPTAQQGNTPELNGADRKITLVQID